MVDGNSKQVRKLPFRSLSSTDLKFASNFKKRNWKCGYTERAFPRVTKHALYDSSLS
jgi:hypothetical protein